MNLIGEQLSDSGTSGSIWLISSRSFQFSSAALLKQFIHHGADFLNQEGHRPFEEVHTTWQMERMNYVLVLLDVHLVVLDKDDGTFVVILTAVVWRAKYRDNRGEGSIATPSMHLVSINLDLMCTDDADEIVGSQDLLHWLEAKLDRALTLRIRAEAHLASITIVHRVRPKEIAEESLERGFFETIDAIDIGGALELWRNTTMHAKVITVDVSSDRHRFEALDEEVVDVLIMELLKDFRPEGEVLCHGTRLVVSSEHYHVAWEVYLQAEEEDTDFEGEDTTINVVTKEKKISPAHSVKKVKQILTSGNKHADLLWDSF